MLKMYYKKKNALISNKWWVLISIPTYTTVFVFI